MSHITQVKTTIEFKNEGILKDALKLMSKEGYTITEKNKDEIWIDLSDRCKHHYHERGAEWSAIRIKRDGDAWKCEGDAWSIQEHYNTAVKSLEKNYVLATVNKHLNLSGYRGAQVKQTEATTQKSIGVVKITARRY